jgi:SAM-dependent methyltransferase
MVAANTTEMAEQPQTRARIGERSRTRLRLLLPAPLKHVGKAFSDSVDPLRIRRYHATSGDLRPVPPGALRARSGRPGIQLFIDSARRSADELEAALAAAGRSLPDFDRVLDFGCGCGRVLGELERRGESGPALFGCDIDGEAIEWAQSHLAGVRLARNGLNPPLPYPDATFDLVYSSSVFTHIDADAQRGWLQAIKRVLRPGGLALISVYGEHAFDGYRSGRLLGVSRDFQSRLADYGSLDGPGIVFAPYGRSAWNNFNFVGTSEAYGITFNSESYVRREWSKHLDVVTVLPRSWWFTSQDLVVLENPRRERETLAAGAAVEQTTGFETKAARGMG